MNAAHQLTSGARAQPNAGTIVQTPYQLIRTRLARSGFRRGPKRSYMSNANHFSSQITLLPRQKPDKSPNLWRAHDYRSPLHMLKLHPKPLLKAAATASVALGAIVLIDQKPAEAVVVVYNGNSYNVVASSQASYNSLSATLQNNPWWGNQTIANTFRDLVGQQLGFPNAGFFAGSPATPLFAYSESGGLVSVSTILNIGNTTPATPSPQSGLPAVAGTPFFYAVATLVPPPAPTSAPGPLPILGAAAAFAWGRKIRSQLKNSASI
jgi:hypothetical protein